MWGRGAGRVGGPRGGGGASDEDGLQISPLQRSEERRELINAFSPKYIAQNSGEEPNVSLIIAGLSVGLLKCNL